MYIEKYSLMLIFIGIQSTTCILSQNQFSQISGYVKLFFRGPVFPL